ncbi:unnamed protein product [Linum tenue]|uniref:Uncharacterized protein n=1 Tax=Linum tenue TaxID=586396 RepID=A0AAV0PC78_9ROSI|nr:unnamed protein product [Linum tenue]
MAIPSTHFLPHILILCTLLHWGSSAARTLNPADQSADGGDNLAFQYHNGALLTGKISVNLIWYGKFKPSQRAIVSDFVASLSSPASKQQPTVGSWWKSTEKYKHSLSLSLSNQILDEGYSLGKSLSSKQIVQLASKGAQSNAVNVVLTSSDVAVEGFCSSKCGTHGSSLSTVSKFAYIWVGNSEKQCPGQCAWPFHQPIYGPQSLPLVSPNNDVGMDGIIINLASLLAGTATNPFGNAASACTGVYGKGAYPGYAGELLLDSTTGASYNANGVNGRKYLLPALFDPASSACSTLV